MTYHVEIHPAALRELHKLLQPAFGAAVKAILGIVADTATVYRVAHRREVYDR